MELEQTGLALLLARPAAGPGQGNAPHAHHLADQREAGLIPILSYVRTQEEDWHCFLAGEPHFLVGEVEVFAIDREQPHLRREKEPTAPPERKRGVFASMVHRLRGSKRTGAKE